MVLGMLTDQQIETYRRDGYLVIPRLIQGDQLAELRGLTDRIVAEARGVSANDDLYDLEPSHSAALPRVRVSAMSCNSPGGVSGGLAPR